MSSAFRAILTLRCAHGWSDGPWLGAGFALTAASERVVRGRRLLTRARGDTLHILAEVADGVAGLPLAGASLLIGLVVLDPAFAHYTAPASRAPAGAVARWSNAASPTRLDRVSPVALDDLLREHPELRPVALAGIADIALTDAFASSPPALELRFEARADPLTYCVVAQSFSADELAQLSVVDTAAAPLTFTRLAEGDLDPAWSACADGAPVVAFRSSAAVARSAVPRRGIELRRAVPTGVNGASAPVTLIAHLPAPGAAPSVVVHVSK